MRKIILTLLIGFLLGTAIASYAQPDPGALWNKIKTAIANIKICRTEWNAVDEGDWSDAKVKERILILRTELNSVEKILLNLRGRIRVEAGED